MQLDRLVDSESLRAQRQRMGEFFSTCFARPTRSVVLRFFLVSAVFIFAFAEGASVLAADFPSGITNSVMGFMMGDWIWTTRTYDEQTCRFWKRFDIPKGATVTQAELTITADNAYHLFLDGRQIGQGAEWRMLTEYNLTRVLGPGPHILAVECFNANAQAGLVGGLHIQMQNGQRLDVPTDASWKIVPNNAENWTTKWNADPKWTAAVVEAKFGQGAWEGHMYGHILLPTPIEPIMITFWESSWFRLLILSVCAVLAVLCFWLVGRLAVYAQAQRVIRRERVRIARDIHDDLTAGLTQLVLLGEVFQNELAEGSEARRRIAKVCEKARGLSRSMNEVIWMVNAKRDTLRDFTSYVCKYAETFLSETPIRCRFDVAEEVPDLPCDLGIRRNLFLGVKEALNNVLRHSSASEVIIRIHYRERQMVVAIEDNGNGFDPALAGQQGNGLSNMIARAAEAGGVCRITSQRESGCQVEFAVPLARDNGHHLRFWRHRSSAPVQISPARSAKPAS